MVFIKLILQRNANNSEDVYNLSFHFSEEHQLKDMKEFQMNQETPRVQDLIADNKKMHETARILMNDKKELANECQGK